MRHVSAAARSLVLLSSSVVILLAFLFVVRPWYQQWGATDEETRRVLPGDEIVPVAVAQETRAITIGASVDRVWPWLAQLGQHRGGFYSYDLLENVVGSRMPTEDRLRPDRQAWRLGDTLWMYPRERAGGVGYAVLRAFVPDRALAFGTHAPDAEASREDGSWAFEEAVLPLHPVGRLGESEEVAGLVAYLASDEAAFLTGASYLADGGYTAQQASAAGRNERKDNTRDDTAGAASGTLRQ
jgi:hypothetical protein